MKSAPGLRGLYPRPERRGFTPLSVIPIAYFKRERCKGPNVGFLATLLFSLPRKQESLDDVSFPAEKAHSEALRPLVY